MLFRSCPADRSVEDVVAEIKDLAGKAFDPEIVAAFVKTQKVSPLLATSDMEDSLELFQLRPGMVLSRDLKTVGGRVLLGKNYALDEDMLERIRKRSQEDPISEEIYVFRKKVAA